MQKRKNVRQQQSLLGFLTVLMVLSIIVIGLVFIIFNNRIPFASSYDHLTSDYLTNGSEFIQEQSIVQQSSVITSPSISFIPVNISDITDTGYLVLVNREHSFSDDSVVSLNSVWPTVPVSVIDGMYLHPTALQAVADMIGSAREQEVGSFFVTSGFRSYNHQVMLYDGGANREFALPPGFSEHHTGLAVDIMTIGISQWELASSPEGIWLAENSWRFGLVLRYPEGAESITGINFEPWHFRYVGAAHAYFMYKNNLVFEEYIKLIKKEGSLSFTYSDVEYLLLFEQAVNGTLNVPEGFNFWISNVYSNNYIITAWKE